MSLFCAWLLSSVPRWAVHGWPARQRAVGEGESTTVAPRAGPRAQNTRTGARAALPPGGVGGQPDLGDIGVAREQDQLAAARIREAGIDPAAAKQLAEWNQNRMNGAAGFIRYLVSLDGVAAAMTEQRAAELCWGLTDGHLYRLLVAQRGWSAADFNKWLFNSLAVVLLPS
jgi:hypothetical protein